MTLSGTVVLLLLRIAWAQRDLIGAYHLHHHHQHLQHQHQECCFVCCVVAKIIYVGSPGPERKVMERQKCTSKESLNCPRSETPSPFSSSDNLTDSCKKQQLEFRKNWRTSKASALDSNKASQDKIFVKEYWSPNQTIKSDRTEICGRNFVCFKIRTSAAAGSASHIVRLPPK